jgi:dTDP-4-dehydrorhamnose reductase
MFPAVPRKERVLVVGASGMLGRSLMRELNRFRSEFEVLGTAHSRVLPGLCPLDAMIASEVAELFVTFQPTKVINCAAERVP